MSISKEAMQEIINLTEQGNPAKPQGKAGALMLENMNEHHDSVTNWGLDFFSFTSDERVLDIGCGGGATLARLANRLGDKGHVTGIDYSSVAVSASKNYNRDRVDAGIIDVIEGTVEKLPFEDNSFTKVVTVESFYFWPDPQNNLREVRRVLKADGTFLLIADIYEFEGLSENARNNVAKFHMYNPTLEQFRELFVNAGFREVIVHTEVGKEWVCVEGRK